MKEKRTNKTRENDRKLRVLPPRRRGEVRAVDRVRRRLRRSRRPHRQSRPGGKVQPDFGRHPGKMRRQDIRLEKRPIYKSLETYTLVSSDQTEQHFQTKFPNADTCTQLMLNASILPTMLLASSINCGTKDILWELHPYYILITLHLVGRHS